MTDRDQTAIVVGAPTAVERETSTILDVLERAARDPSVDVGKLERILAIQQTLLADQRRAAFMAALARLQAVVPQIAKSGTIEDRDGRARNTFAKLEDIDVSIRPLCAAEGFSFSFDTRAGTGGTEYSCAMSHRDGHTEVKTLVLPLDTGAGRNAVQSAGSSLSYARRYLLSMHLHLVTRAEDDDGNGGAGTVTQEQADELRRTLAEVGGDEVRFLRWAGAATVEEIGAGKLGAARKFLEEKKRRRSC